MQVNVVIDSGYAYLEPSRKYSASYTKESKLGTSENESWLAFTEISHLLRKAEDDGFPLL